MKITRLRATISEIIDVKSYTGEDCDNCGRCRIELVTVSSGNQYHICEKCGYIKEMQRTLFKKDLSCDECYDGKYYLREVIELHPTDTKGVNRKILFASSEPVKFSEEDDNGFLRRINYLKRNKKNK